MRKTLFWYALLTKGLKLFCNTISRLICRVPCTAKSDNDLPRYGKRWDYTPNIPATMRPESSVPEPAVGEDPSSLQLDNLQDAFVVGQTVTIAGISVSAGSDTLATVVQVLDSDLPADEQNLIKAVVESVGSCYFACQFLSVFEEILEMSYEPFFGSSR